MATQLVDLPTGKREQTKVANRQAILDAARAVFGELGYDTATVRDIIRRTGLAAGTFYNYFRSKEEVFAALADEGAARFNPILKALRSQGQTFEVFVEQAIAAANNGAGKGSIAIAIGLSNTEGAPTVTALPPHRAAEEYEALRDAAAAFADRTGNAPVILQLNIGPSRKYRLRADWTSSFFAAAGVAIDGAGDFATAAEAIAALTKSQAAIAVITSDDATYLETVASLAAAAKAAKPDVTLLVAGAPGDNETAWRAAGVDDFVNVRSNNYELNRTLLAKAGVI